MKIFTKAYWEQVLFPEHAEKLSKLEFQVQLLQNSVVELGRRLELKANPKSAWLQPDTVCIQDPPPVQPKPERQENGGWLTSK